MHYLYRIPVTVLLTQELTSLHVVSGLKTDQRPQLGLCLHSDLLATSELPVGGDWVFYLCYLIPRKLLTQCLRTNHLITRPCEMMGTATPDLGKGRWHLRDAIFWGVRVTCCKEHSMWGLDKLCCWCWDLWLLSCCLKRRKILCNRKQTGSCPSVWLLF